MAFGKPGRPSDDPLVRQHEIFVAVSPLILSIGARRLSMRQAARAACLSVGGLYHHFPTKRDLLLHGMRPDAIARMCQDFHASVGPLAELEPAVFFEAYLDFVADSVGFIQPSVYAALDLGMNALDTALEPMLAAANVEFAALLPATFPDASPDDVAQLGRAIHRVLLSALFDKTVTPQELRREVMTLIHGYGVTVPMRSLAPALQEATTT